MTTLKKLFNKYTWDDILPRMKRWYPKPKKNLVGYEEAFRQIKKIKPKQSKKKIRIELEPFYDRGYDIFYIHVHGKTSKTSYCLMFTPWEEWLSYEISNNTEFYFEPIDIICHCLWEMTYCGFNNIIKVEKNKALK